MISQFIFTSLILGFSSQSSFGVPPFDPMKAEIQGAVQTIQENIENTSPLVELEQSLLLENTSTHASTFTPLQISHIQTVEDQIKQLHEDGNTNEAIALTISLQSMLEAYATFTNSDWGVDSRQKFRSFADSSTILLVENQSVNYLLEIRKEFVQVSDTLTDEQRESIESELTTAEQLLLTTPHESIDQSLQVLETVEKYIYHAHFLVQQSVLKDTPTA